jgi:antirestriction protein ArdC
MRTKTKTTAKTRANVAAVAAADRKSATDVMADVVANKLIAMMGDGSDAAMKLWRKSLSKFAASGLPYNADNGRPYSGGNVFQLWLTANERGFTSNGWVTMGNMIKRGWNIKKGCKAPWQWVLSPRMKLTKKDAAGKPVVRADGTVDSFMGPQRAYKVFNMDCIETNGSKMPGRKLVCEADVAFDAMNDIVTAHGIKIEHGGDVACYYPTRDFIRMPQQAQFTTEQAYYHVLAHEVTHWTGHTSRCDRKLLEQGGFGSEGYAFEELVAELGSALVMSSLGMGDSQMPAHANYLKSWIKALQNDTGFILKAASKASAACTFILAPLVAAEADEPEGVEEVQAMAA